MIKKFYLKFLMGLLLTSLAVPHTQAETLTVANGTGTDQYMPIYGSAWKTNGAGCQFIYPASELSNLSNGAIIKKIKFFSSSTVNSKLGYSTTAIRLGNTQSTTIANNTSAMAANRENMTLVFTGNLPTGSTEMEITCSTDFVYQAGQNLIVDTYVTSASSTGYYSQYWYVNSGYSSGCVAECNGTSVYSDSKLPKMEITYELGTVEEYAAVVTPTTLAFGEIPVGGEITQTITLRNTGANAFTPSLNISNSAYTTTYSPTSLASGASIEIPIKFNPTTTGNFDGTLTIDCGNAGVKEVALTGSGSYSATIGGDASTSEYLPVYGYNHDSYNQQNQFVYPASMLTSLVGKRLKSITFYPSGGIKFYNGSVSFSLANVASGSITFTASGNTPQSPSGLTQVGTITMPSSAQSSLTEWTLSFDGDGFDYTGGDLFVDVTTVKGSWGTTNFYGTTTEDYVGYSCTSSSAKTGQKFLPKVKFTYEDSYAPATPTITANPASVSLTTEVGTPVTGTFSVTGANLTGDITVAASGDGFSVAPATITAADAANGVTVTVTYNPAAAGTHTGAITLSSDGATSKTVNLNGTATLPPVPMIVANPTALTMNAIVGTPATSTFTVTGSNLEGDITVAASGEGFSVAPATITAADAANGATVTVTYNPAAAGNHTGSISLTSTNADAVTVALTGTAATPVISGTVTPATLNFSCYAEQTATGTITVENTGNQAFTPAFNLAAPFSIEAATEIAAGASKQFTVTYAPTAAGTHTGTLTVTINGTDTQVALNGTATEAPEGGELTVAESTTTGDKYMSSIAPIYGGRYNSTGTVQMLYPASLLTDMVGMQITKVTFRHYGAPGFSGGAVQVSIGETENANLSGGEVSASTLTAVATVSPIGSAFDNEYYLTFEFSRPYLYNGGNLVIQTHVTTEGSESRSRFYGKSTYDLSLGNITTLATSYSAQTGNGYSTSFLPQATFTYEKARGVELVSPEDGILNFGEVSVKGHKTMTITVKNNNSTEVTVSASDLAYPYSVVDAPASIAAGETATFSVDMKPNNDTENIDYNNVQLTLTFGTQEMVITINGTSHVNEPTMTTEDFAEIEYTWVDENGDTQTSNLAEVATDPAQMIALMREVYMNRNVPGNWYRGYTKAGEPSYEVAYPAIGKIVYDNENLNYTYSDSYGWNIGFSENVNDHILTNPTYNQYRYFNPDEYKPIKNGVTLLLVEMNDNIVSADGNSYTEIVNGINSVPSGYNALKSMVGTVFKSVRVVTQSRNMGAGEDAGTLFKLDCDKMNRFFLLAKGRLRMFSGDVTRHHGSYIDATSTGNSYREFEEMGPFYQMYEQLSPVDLANVSDVTDVYQKLVNMESYGIEHDCQSIAFISYDGVTGHEFNMYGKASISDDCQDVRDLMITIPERRMQWWYEGSGNNSRDGYSYETDANDMFVNYNKQRVPKMGLFVIKQFPITGEQQENANVYDLNLSWTSNLLEFLPTGYGVYNLYRVVTNADGTKTYTKVVDNLDPNTFSYVDHVEMQQTGQVVTYVVQGQDQEKFLSMQLSNEESFVIPGLDRREQIIIALNNDYYYSRYDAANQKNNYSNSLIANNTVGTNVKPEYLTVWQDGSDKGMFKFWRATLKTVDGEQVVDTENAVNFANCKVTALNETSGTLTYEAGDDQATFTIGYHQNTATSTISIVNGEVKFDGLKLYDNFSVSVEENTHPAQYVYYVTLKTAVPFNLNDEGTETSDEARSNTVSVPVYKTGMAMNPLSATDVENDVTHETPAATKFDLNARYSSKSEILGYYIYRWADKETAANERSIYEANGDDASPQGQAGNQGTYYTVAMNTDYTAQTENFAMDANGNHPDVTATFMDNYMVKDATNADTYTYAPVVELFAPQQAVELPSGVDREDYNTYGGPQQMTAGGVVNVEVLKPAQSTYTWTANGKTYTYYNVFLDVSKLSIPQDYEIVKVRAWRKIDSEYLGEETGKGYEWRINDIVNGELKFIEHASCTEGEELGSEGSNDIFEGTFGAVKLSGSEKIPMDFVVRVYFTKSLSGAKAADPDGDYYIAEYTINDALTSDIPTSIFGVDSYKVVTGIKYYNPAGVESDVPFQGVNIEVTTYDDGSRTTRKLLK